MDYNDLSCKAHENAVNHGFWDDKYSVEHYLMLIITEIAEMVDADRNGAEADVKQFDEDCSLKPFGMCSKKSYKDAFNDNIKNTFQDEMADVAIRLGDLAGALGINFDIMQPCRYYRAFDKFSVTENCYALCKGLSKERIAISRRIQFGLFYIENWAKSLEIDIDKHIKIKMIYNLSRPEKHGKKY